MQVLPDIKEKIASCDFISIDTELSGLRKGSGGHLFDDHQERYEKLRASCMGYSIIQFGISCFKKLDDCQHYSSHGFNIYIFPYKIQGIPRQPERNIDFQVSAVTFLRNHKFDFNMLFDSGLCYLTTEEEEQIKKIMSDNEDREMSRSLTVVPEEHQEFVNDCVAKVDAFLTNDLSSQLELQPCNAFRRKLVYEALSGSKYRSKLDINTRNVSPLSRDSFLLITKATSQEKWNKQRDLLTEASGFSRILQYISQCKKPIVGHNVFLDILHSIGQFMTSNVPNSYEDYKEMVHTLFPEIYDTKFISSTAAFKNIITSSTLEDLERQLSQEPFKRVLYSSSSECSPGQYHEAGYDADVTGQCFIAMNNFLQEKFDKNNCQEAIGSEMKRFVNRLNLTFSFDLDHYHFGGPEVKFPRDQVFYISFPDDYNQQKLNHLMSPFGYFQYQWLGDSSMLIGFKDASRISDFKKAFQNNSHFKILAFHDFKINQKRMREEVEKGKDLNSSYKRAMQSLTPGLKKVRVDRTSSSPVTPEEETTMTTKRSMTTYFDEVADW